MTSVLVDTSVWVSHFRRRSSALLDFLHRDLVLVHPFVLGELACGTPPDRKQTLADLAELRQASQANLQEVMGFVERESLYGQGCGIVDLTLLASTLMTPETTIWTLDRRLSALARRFSVLNIPAGR